MNGRSGRGPVLDRTVPSRGRRSRGTSLKNALTAHKRKLRAAAVVAVLASALVITFVSALAPSSAAPDRDPILILGDSDFTEANGVRSGSGVAEDPFIIENWLIDSEPDYHGIYIEGTTAYFVIRDVTISGCLSGVNLNWLSNGNVSDNVISGAVTYGVYTYDVDSTVIWSNTISDCEDTGIWIDDDSSDIVVTRNKLTNNMCGSAWTGYAGGVWLNTASSVSVYYNGFYSNHAPQAYDYHGSGIWSAGPPPGGNYWSDYAGVDDNEDGYGDTPYTISGFVGNQDDYPLIDDPFEEVIPEFSTVLVPVLVVMAVFLVARRRSSTR